MVRPPDDPLDLGGGFRRAIFLFVPSLFQVVPNQWRDSCGGLAVLGAIQIAALAVLFPPFQTLSAI